MATLRTDYHSACVAALCTQSIQGLMNIRCDAQAIAHPELDHVQLGSPIQDIATRSRAEQTAHVLRVLQQVPWARVDCSWRDATFSMFAHNLIQVTRRWAHYEGRSVTEHLAQRFVDLEQHTATLIPGYSIGCGTRSNL